jgi:hypothetical protein
VASGAEVAEENEGDGHTQRGEHSLALGVATQITTEVTTQVTHNGGFSA